MAEPVDHRDTAVSLFNRCWELLGSDLDDEGRTELLTAAFTSRWHWRQVGGPDQFVVSDWMVSRAAAASQCPALSVLFARRAHDGLSDSSPDWMRASAAEGLAHAYRAAGPPEEYQRWLSVAEGLVAQIADDEDREIIAAQLDQTRGD